MSDAIDIDKSKMIENWIYEKPARPDEAVPQVMAQTIQKYSDLAWSTAIYPMAGNNVFYVFNGLMGELGELHEQMKKIVRDDDFTTAAAYTPSASDREFSELDARMLDANMHHRTLRQSFRAGLLMQKTLPERMDKIKHEAGDLFWYINAMAREVFGVKGLTLMMETAIQKQHMIGSWRSLSEFMEREELSDDLFNLLHKKAIVTEPELTGQLDQLNSLHAIEHSALAHCMNGFVPISASRTQHLSATNLLLIEIGGDMGLGFLREPARLCRLLDSAEKGANPAVGYGDPSNILRLCIAYAINHLRDFLHLCGYRVDEVLNANLVKLLSRKERGVLQGSGSNR